MDSNVTLLGNITQDPELKFTTGGTARLSFSIAVDRRYQVNNEWTTQTSFFNCVAWAQVAENAARSLSKGVKVLLTGRLEQRSWEDKESGQKRSTVEVVCDEVAISTRHIGDDFTKFVPERTEGQASGGGNNRQRPAQQQARLVPEEEAW